LGSSIFLYQLLDAPGRQYQVGPFGHLVDVRDIAKIHLLALSSPLIVGGERKRLIASAGSFRWSDVVAIIREKIPELDERLPYKDAVPGPQMSAPLDTSLTKRMTGFSEYIHMEKTILDAFESILTWEKRLKE